MLSWLAHSGAPPTPETLWGTWSASLPVAVGLTVGAGIYGRGVVRIWRRAGAGRGVRRGQVAAYGAGLATLIVALLSPLDALASALFSAHMAQHLLLTTVAAPLLVIGASRRPIARAFGPGGARLLGRWARWLSEEGRRRRGAAFVVAPAAFTVTLWLWHAPALYTAALDHELVHLLEHVTLLATAVLVWWVVIGAGRRGSPLAGVVTLFVVSLSGVALAALIALSPEPWYPAYEETVRAWGLTPLQDQQLAGASMWVPAGLVYLVAAAGLVLRWLGRGPVPAANAARAVGE